MELSEEKEKCQKLENNISTDKKNLIKRIDKLETQFKELTMMYHELLS